MKGVSSGRSSPQLEASDDTPSSNRSRVACHPKPLNVIIGRARLRLRFT